MHNKGIQLPTNMLVVLALGIIVFFALLLFFLNNYGQPGGTVSLESAKTDACTRLLSSGQCSSTSAPSQILVYGYDANNNGNLNDGDNLEELCRNYYAADLSDIITTCSIRVCNCPENSKPRIIGGGGGGGPSS